MQVFQWAGSRRFWRLAYVLFACCIAAITGTHARAEARLPPILSDHMVLQREMKVPIWGEADPAERITVTFAGQTHATIAGADGKWRVDLEPMPASANGRDLVVSAGNTITLRDVLVGEVWLGSGQSNMDMAVREYRVAVEAAVPLADNPLVRFHGQREPGTKFGTNINGKWTVMSAETAPSSSAMLFFFAVRLQKELGVPVGVISRAYGGSAAGVWCDPAAFEADAICAAALKKYAEEYPALVKAHQDRVAEVQRLAADTQPGQAAPRMPYPPRQPSTAGLGVGTGYRGRIKPMVPYAVRGVVWDQGESGPGVPHLSQYDMMRVLIASWRTAWGRTADDIPFLIVQKPSGGGWVWAPGQKDREGRPVKPPALPLSPEVTKERNGGGWSRESYQRLVELPSTAMANTMDLGSGVHPGDKDAYGYRLADLALGKVYGKNTAWQTPRFHAMKISGTKVVITFRDVGKGLTLAPGAQALTGFAVAGADRRFVWAQARITGVDTVQVWADEVPDPVAVRYAWADAPRWASLVGANGLRAWAFRTDQWD